MNQRQSWVIGRATRLFGHLLRLLFLALALLPALTNHLQAQVAGEPVVIGRKIQIHSRILDEDRTLLIATPSGYDQGTERYPVLYLLDAEDNFVQTAGIAGSLDAADRIPPMLIVGIVNTQRVRDLTTPTEDEIENRFHPGNGGADRFLEFIKAELIPFVDQHYRTRPYKVLVGHSAGGFFALHVLASNPQMFNAYIAIDPMLSWNHESPLSRIETMFEDTKELNSDLYVTASGEAGVTHRLCAILADKAPKKFRWTFKPMADETHLSLVHLSIYSGLATIFDGWHLAQPLKLYDEGGLAAVDRHFSEGGKRYGYERQTSPFMVSLIVAALLARGSLEEAGSLLLHDPKRYPPPWNQLEALARAYARQGNNPEAIRFYKLSLRQNPENQWARKKLAEMEGNVGRKTPAQPH